MATHSTMARKVRKVMPSLARRTRNSSSCCKRGRHGRKTGRKPTDKSSSVKHVPNVESCVHRNHCSKPAPTIDPRLADSDPTELLGRIISPMSVRQFLESCWAVKAAVFQGPVARMRPIIKHFMHDLDLEALVSDSPSERIHAWVGTSSSSSDEGGASKRLDSVGVDPDAALGLARAGAALYFRAPEDLESLLVPGICDGLGSSFAGRYPGDGKPRGEIETFVAGKGHITGWHTDFQHNFTLQLKGSKTWYLKSGPVKNNIRALTPHYQARSNFEQQMKLHLIADPKSPDYEPPASFFKDAEKVTLQAGDVLYHPAGIWHQVECTEGSISINVSLTSATWADLFSDALRQLFWSSPLLREPLVGLHASASPAFTALANVHLREMQRFVANLRVDDLLPPAVLDARQAVKRINVCKSKLGQELNLTPDDRLRFSRLSVLVEMPEGIGGSDSSEEDGVNSKSWCSFALHSNFGNEEAASWLRLELLVPNSLRDFLMWLQRRQLMFRQSESRGSKSKCTFTARDILKDTGNEERGAAILRLLKVLRYCGHVHRLTK